jgi:hypothetical protein
MLFNSVLLHKYICNTKRLKYKNYNKYVNFYCKVSDNAVT